MRTHALQKLTRFFFAQDYFGLRSITASPPRPSNSSVVGSGTGTNVYVTERIIKQRKQWRLKLSG
jgi:hypothetical protein